LEVVAVFVIQAFSSVHLVWGCFEQLSLVVYVLPEKKE
jgi:hypothetical protein